ncbi:hypothetical protein RAH24_10495 [Klebsiella pneumoniae]
MKHQHGRESAGMIFIARFMNSFLHQASFATGYWCYDRHRSVRLVVLVGLAIDQIAQSGLSSLSVIYYSAQLFKSQGEGFLSPSKAALKNWLHTKEKLSGSLFGKQGDYEWGEDLDYSIDRLIADLQSHL